MEPRRNDPCSCGSGRKYKKCCADLDVAPGRDQVGQAAELVRVGDFLAAVDLFAGSGQVVKDCAGAFYQLGVALKERGVPVEAAACYRQALARRPDYVEALNNLGVILQEQNEFGEAADFLQKALKLKPEAALAHYNFGVVLVELNRRNEARCCFEQALALEPGYVEAHYNLGLLARQEGEWATAASCFRRALELRADYPRTSTELAILSWMAGDFVACASCLEQIVHSRKSLSVKEQKFVGPYRNYLEKLLDYRLARADLYRGGADRRVLYAVGDSHCLATAHLPVAVRGEAYRVEARVVIGAKAWHLGLAQANGYQRTLEKIVAAIPTGASALALFGEIDCRLDEGIMHHHRKTGNDLGRAIPELVGNYVATLDRVFGARAIKLLIANVPAPIIHSAAVPDEERLRQGFVVREFNLALASCCAVRQIPLLDVYSASARSDGLAHGQCHLDSVHLEPALYQRLLGEL